MGDRQIQVKVVTLIKNKIKKERHTHFYLQGWGGVGWGEGDKFCSKTLLRSPKKRILPKNIFKNVTRAGERNVLFSEVTQI